MKIALTKALIKAFNIDPEPPYEEDPLYSFHATIYALEPGAIDANPHPMHLIVFQNDATRYTVFRLSGGGESQKPNTLVKAFYTTYKEALILNGFSKDTVNAFVPSERPIRFVEVSEQERLVELNAMRNQFYLFYDAVNPTTLDQPHLTHLINRSMHDSLEEIKSIEPVQALYQSLKGSFSHPFSFISYELKFSLALNNHSVTRTVIIPSFYTLREVHDTVKALFLWDHSHMLRSHMDDTLGHIFYSDYYGLEACERLPNERHVRSENLKDFLDEAKDPYIYDLIDGWFVQIQILRTLPNDTIMVPRCTGGNHPAPSKNFGAVEHYEKLLQLMEISTRPEYYETKDFFDEVTYEPFNKDRINASLFMHSPVLQIDKNDQNYRHLSRKLKNMARDV